MYLIDTSVWIDFFRNRPTHGVKLFNQILDGGFAYGINALIYQEVLQGASSPKDFHKLKDYLSTQRFFHFNDPIKSHENAAHIFFACRQKGITIRSTIDCLIAQTAIENKLILLHSDKDYERIAQVVPLKIA